MPTLDNPKHELFAQRLARGESQADAYAAAGYQPSEPHASRLASHGKVQARVAEILGRAAERAEISVASLTDRLVRIADIAEATGVEKDETTGAVTRSSSKHLTVAKGAIMDLAKLNGMIVERREVGVRRLADVPDDELDQEIATLNREVAPAGPRTKGQAGGAADGKETTH